MKQEIQLTVIQRIIYYSKCILALRISLIQLQRTKETLNLIPIPFPEFYRSYIFIKDEIENQIMQWEIKIKTLLYPLLQGIDFGYNETDRYWHLTVEDLQKGYLLLEKVENDPNKNPEKYVISLSSYNNNGNIIKEGNLIPFAKVAPLLSKFKDMRGNTPKIQEYLNTKLSKVDFIPRVRRIRT